MPRTIGVVLLGLVTLIGSPVVAAQRGEDRADAILDMLIWGPSASAADPALAEPLGTEVREYLQRANSYRSGRPVPSSDDLRVATAAWVGHERRLVAVTGDPRAPRLAADYVDRLRPCYEWEGMSGCPAAEASFADTYRLQNPRSPFAEYLPLLAAHRWLCAAELFAFETKVPQAADARRNYGARLATARKSTSLLVRTAAERLAVRATCFAAQ